MNLDKKLLGKQIRQRRIENKISQEKLSEIIDISPRHMCTIENGKSFPSIDTFLKIAETLNIDLNDFFDIQYTLKKDSLRSEIIQLIKIVNEKDLPLLKEIISSVIKYRN